MFGHPLGVFFGTVGHFEWSKISWKPHPSCNLPRHCFWWMYLCTTCGGPRTGTLMISGGSRMGTSARKKKVL
jgi:hypothetical protein